MTQQRYSTAAIILHWMIAVLLLYNVWLGWRYSGQEHNAVRFLMSLPLIGDLMAGVPTRGLEKFNILQLHKSIGITVLILTVARLALRLVKRPPPYPAHMKAWEKGLAKTTHWAFYIIMIGLPLSGWVMVSASMTNLPTLLYQTIPWPHLPFIHEMAEAGRKSAERSSGLVHFLLANLTYLLVILHVAGALKHQIVDRDGSLWRMAPLPFLRSK